MCQNIMKMAAILKSKTVAKNQQPVTFQVLLLQSLVL